MKMNPYVANIDSIKIKKTRTARNMERNFFNYQSIYY